VKGLACSVSCAVIMACVHEAHVPAVDIGAVPFVQTTSEGTLLDECRIVGTGERSTYSKEQPSSTSSDRSKLGRQRSSSPRRNEPT